MSRESTRRFHFLREIASGGFGTVYLCKVMHADGFSRVAAVKLLNEQWLDSDEVAGRLRDEARLLGLLRHRHIVNVFDLTSIEGRGAIIMEYLEAIDMGVVAEEVEAAGIQIPTRCALEVVSAVASALDAAYNRPPVAGDKPLRVIHRDIKPSNIMLDDTGMVKVLDFGVARSELENRESHTRELQFGSVQYMAPERLFFEPETPASDVYSLATTLYELLTGEQLGKARGRPNRHQAFISERLGFLRRIRTMPSAVSRGVEELIRESLHFEHEKRPTSAEFHTLSRTLARQCRDEDLATWSEQLLPAWIKRAQERPRKSDPMTNSILTEDSMAMSIQPPPTPDALLPPDPSSGILGNALGERLRRGALAELEDSEEIMLSAPPTGSPLGGNWLPTMDPPSDWEDIPTKALDPTLRTPRQPSLSTEDALASIPRAAAAVPDPVLPSPDALPAPTLRPLLRSPATIIPPDLPDASDRPTELGFVPPAFSPVPAPVYAETDDAATELMTIDQLRAAAQFEDLPPRSASVAQATAAAHSTAPARGIELKNAPILSPASDVTLHTPDADATQQIRHASAPIGIQQGQPAQGRPRKSKKSTNKKKVIAVFAAVVLLVPIMMVVIIGGALALDVGGIKTLLVAQLDRTPSDAPAAAPDSDTPVPDSDTPSSTADEIVSGMRFLSEDPNTKKLTVRCDGTTEKGSGEVAVALASAETCTVTSMAKDRSRRNAILSGVVTGSYVCFVGDEDTCTQL